MKRTLKRSIGCRLAAIAIAAAGLFFFTQPLRAEVQLPEIDGWTCGELRVTQLDSVTGNHGEWSMRRYSSSRGTFIATMMTGNGPKYLYIPSDDIAAGDGPLGSGASYETRIVYGRRAIAETHPLLGTSLTVALTGRTLVLESPQYGMSTDDLADAAAAVIQQLR